MSFSLAFMQVLTNDEAIIIFPAVTKK